MNATRHPVLGWQVLLWCSAAGAVSHSQWRERLFCVDFWQVCPFSRSC